jgi:hypothetical protein
LRYTLGNPYNIADFLLLQLDICKEGGKVELLLECQAVQEDFISKKFVFHGRLVGRLIKELPIFLT